MTDEERTRLYLYYNALIALRNERERLYNAMMHYVYAMDRYYQTMDNYIDDITSELYTYIKYREKHG